MAKHCYFKNLIIISVCVTSLFTWGCQESQIVDGLAVSSSPKIIGDVFTVVAFKPTQLKGFGIVVGLNGTGSNQCPPSVRSYLRSYIKTNLRDFWTSDPDELIDSMDTTVVNILAILPAGAMEGEKFDLMVGSLNTSQTSTLAGGKLLKAELKSIGAAGQSKAMAAVQGEIYLDNDDARIGYVLGGGQVLKSQEVMLGSKRLGYAETSIIRDKINEKFGPDTCKAVADGRILLNIPEKYLDRKKRYLDLVMSIYYDISNDNLSVVVDSLIKKLKHKDSAAQALASLEMIGVPAANKLKPLLSSADKDVALRAASCLLSIGDYSGYESLIEMALNKSYDNRLEAINSIGWSAKRNDAVSVLKGLLGDDDFAVRLSVYEHLRRLDDMSISQKPIRTSSGQFLLERIIQAGKKVIWASQSGEARVTLFGSPIYCEKDIFVESADRSVIATSNRDYGFVTLARTMPITGEVITVKSSPEVGLVIKALCKKPGFRGRVGGLGLSYSQAVDFVKELCQRGAVDAEFIFGNEPEIKKYIKKRL